MTEESTKDPTNDPTKDTFTENRRVRKATWVLVALAGISGLVLLVLRQWEIAAVLLITAFFTPFFIFLASKGWLQAIKQPVTVLFAIAAVAIAAILFWDLTHTETPVDFTRVGGATRVDTAEQASLF